MAVVLEWSKACVLPKIVEDKAKSAQNYVGTLQQLAKNPDWSAPEASIFLPGETKFAKASKSAANACKNASLFVVIGIGGSNLGAMAAYDFIFGRQANLLLGKKLIFADTTDPSTIGETIRLMKQEISKKGRVVLNIVSKSGGTTETLANFESIYATLSQQERKSVKIYATTDAGSKLHEAASKKGWATLPIPPAVGGRYSVFSCAGLFPLAWAGVDIDAMLSGASKMLDSCLLPDFRSNPALAQAALMHAHCASGKNMLISFIFANDLQSYGLWWRQLLAESAGKCPVAPTPIVSMGSTDLHSQAQLYLGGPHDKAFRFVSVSQFAENQLIPSRPELALAQNLAGKSTAEVFSALLNSTKASFSSNRIPFWEISLPHKSEEFMGALLQLDMMSVMYFCRMLGVNAFDQPAVEAYKKEARKLL